MKIETRPQFFMRCAMLALALVMPAAALTASSHALLMAYHPGAKRPAPGEFAQGPHPAAGVLRDESSARADEATRAREARSSNSW